MRRNPKDFRSTSKVNQGINAKVIKAYNGIFEPFEHILSFMGITAYFGIF